MEKLSQDLVPKEANLVRKHIKRKKKEKPAKLPVDHVVKPALQGFESLNPFSNCKSFIQFYRYVLSGLRPKVIFYSFDSETNYALTLMDNLQDAGKFDNVEFLRSWIKYFSTYHLKGRSISNPKRTSLKAFTATLDEYNSKYIGA